MNTQLQETTKPWRKMSKAERDVVRKGDGERVIIAAAIMAAGGETRMQLKTEEVWELARAIWKAQHPNA